MAGPGLVPGLPVCSFAGWFSTGTLDQQFGAPRSDVGLVGHAEVMSGSATGLRLWLASVSHCCGGITGATPAFVSAQHSPVCLSLSTMSSVYKNIIVLERALPNDLILIVPAKILSLHFG